jgi:hypothetical protein
LGAHIKTSQEKIKDVGEMYFPRKYKDALEEFDAEAWRMGERRVVRRALLPPCHYHTHIILTYVLLPFPHHNPLTITFQSAASSSPNCPTVQTPPTPSPPRERSKYRKFCCEGVDGRCPLRW